MESSAPNCWIRPSTPTFRTKIRPLFSQKSDQNQTKNDLKSDLFPQKQDIGVKNDAKPLNLGSKLVYIITILSKLRIHALFSTTRSDFW